MKNTYFLALIACFMLYSCGQMKKTSDTASDDKKDWKKLFKVKDITNWLGEIQHHEVEENYGNTFRVEDGIIKIRYDQYGDFNDQFGHLYYKTPYSYYHLKFEYRFVGKLQKGAPGYTLLNSGIMFHSQDPRTMLKE